MRGNEKRQRIFNGADRVLAGSRFRREFDFLHRVSFVSVVVFFRECLCFEVINVEARHAAHFRMAGTKIKMNETKKGIRRRHAPGRLRDAEDQVPKHQSYIDYDRPGEHKKTSQRKERGGGVCTITGA